MTTFEATNSVFNISIENISFSITTPGHWISRGGSGTIIKLREFLEHREGKDFELHVEEVRKRENEEKLGNIKNNLSIFETRKNEISEDLKIVEYNGLEDAVFRYN